jgi:hypothetical protein
MVLSKASTPCRHGRAPNKLRSDCGLLRDLIVDRRSVSASSSASGNQELPAASTQAMRLSYFRTLITLPTVSLFFTAAMPS